VGEKYTGVIAGQMMLTPIQGPTVIEFYSRFGDPEIGCLIPRIESDFLEIIERTVSGRLAGAKLEVKRQCSKYCKSRSTRRISK